MDKFAHLHLHSDCSFLDSLSKIEDIVDKIKEHGQSAFALTDHGSTMNLINGYKLAKKAGIKFIPGSEFYLVEDCVKAKDNKQRYAYHIVLLAMNNVGFRNILKLSTESHRNFYYKPRIDFNLLEKHSDGIIVLTACMHGLVAYNLFDHKDKEDESIVKYPCNIPLAESYVEKLKGIFGNRFYLEVQDGGIPEQITINARIREIGKKFDVKTVATVDSHYINKDDALIHTYLKSIAFGAKTNAVAESGNGFQTQEFYIKKRSEVGADIQEEELDRTLEIADRCNVDIEIGKYKIPKYDRGSSVPSLDLLKDKLKISWDIKLTTLQQIDQRYKERLDKELCDVDKANLADYFLIVADIVNYAKSQNWWIGPGRGSASGSLISYLLNITTIDPIENGLIWERFFNIGRKGSMADIDIDVEKRYRDNLVQYIKDRFGNDHVAQVSTFNALATRAVLKDVFRVGGISVEESNKITACVPLKNDDHASISLSEALVKSSELREYEEKYKSLFAVAKRLEGVYRSSGTHAAAIVISNEPFSEGSIPLCREPNGEGLMSAWDMHTVEDVGLLKIDILGLTTLEVLHRCVDFIKERHKVDIDINNLTDNPNVWELFDSGILEGVFQLETNFGRSWCKKMKPQSLQDLSDLISIIRPAAIESQQTNEYLAVRHKEKEPSYIHDSLEPILSKTNGALVYQEQVLEICNKLAGMSLEQSDLVRYAVGKKKMDVIKQQKDLFINGCLNNNIASNIADEIWRWIELQATYSFNRSHSLAYATLGYRTAWLKANYPHEFYLANLLVCKDHDEISRFICDAKLKGVEVKLPNIKTGNIDFELHDNDIYFGLAYIKNVGEKSLSNISKLQNVESWISAMQIINNIKLNKQTVIALISSGALDHLQVDRSRMRVEYNLLSELTPNESTSWNKSNLGLVDFLEIISDDIKLDENKKTFGKIPNVNRRKKIKNLLTEYRKASVVDDYMYRLGLEKYYIGISVSGHETDVYLAMSKAKETCLNVNRGLLPGTEVDLCILIDDVRMIMTKKSQEMAFVKGSDNTCSLDSIVVFPKTFIRYKHLLEAGRIVNLNGKISDRGGVICNRIEMLR